MLLISFQFQPMDVEVTQYKPDLFDAALFKQFFYAILELKENFYRKSMLDKDKNIIQYKRENKNIILLIPIISIHS